MNLRWDFPVDSPPSMARQVSAGEAAGGNHYRDAVKAEKLHLHTFLTGIDSL